jgi:glycosyltransferase involved in cell wall biosynthesis
MGERVLILIPAYNEEKTITKVLNGLCKAVPKFDRVIVNDGSKDSTSEILEQLGEKQLRLPCNLGYGLALQTGLKYALQCGYDIIVTIDADGQHNPDDVPRLVAALIESDADLVIGSRYSGGRPYTGPLGRRLGQTLFSRLTRLLTGQRICDTTSGFKALRASACEAIVHGTFLDFHTEMLVRMVLLGFKIVEVDIIVKERAFGQSMYSLSSAFEYPLKTLLLTLVSILDVLLVRRKR